MYPVYSALAVQFDLGVPPCRDLDDVDVHSEPHLLERVEKWFAELDDSLEVQHFRQLLHGTGVGASEEKLNALIERHLRKPDKSDADRDKLDFLLVQYFAVCAPPSFQERELSLDDVGEILEPVLGRGPFEMAPWLKPLDGWISGMQQFASLEQLHQSGIVQQGRQLKEAAKHLYFTPAALLAFTRFSYALRRSFFRLINTDLKSIEANFALLEQRGCAAVDGRALEMSANMPLAELRHYAENFKKVAVPDYADDTLIRNLVELRRVLDNAAASTGSAVDPAWQQIEQRFRRVEEELSELRAFVSSLLANRTGAPPARVAERLMAAPLPEPPQVDLSVPFEFARAPQPEAETSPGDQLAGVLETVEESFLVEDRPAETAEPPAEAEPADAEPAAPGAEEQTPAPAAEAGPSHDSDVGKMIEEIRRRLNAAGRRGISSIAIAGTALLLTADEVDAFLRPKEGSSTHLQRALAVRALLLHALETNRRTGRDTGLASVVEFCHAELEGIQNRTSTARQANRNEFAAALTASGNQLGTLLKQAERIARAGAQAAPVTA